MSRQYPTFSECAFLIKKPFYYLPVRPWLLRRSANQLQLPQQFPPSLQAGDPLVGETLLDGFFEFDGERHEFETRIWRFRQATPNWHQHLHSFEWLHHLKATTKDEARSAAAGVVLDWCRRHRSWRKVSWNSTTTARRICSWLSLFDFISAKMTPEQKRVFVESLWSQILHLKWAYPLDAVGADRISVAKVLILGNLAFPTKLGRNFSGWKLLERELRRQILPDGGLIERSAGRNLQALIDLIEVRAGFRAFGQAVPPTLDLAIRLISTLVEALTMPDGKLAHHHAGVSNELLTRALSLSPDKEARTSFPESGFERLEAKRSILILNTGQVDAPLNNRYLHSAPLAFEFSLGKQRLIVNCGSHPDSQRFGEIERATSAHSTLAIEDVNALPIQPIMGTDDQCLQNTKTAETRVVRDKGELHESLSVSHGAYERIGGGYHTRQLQLEADGEQLLGLDVVSNCQKPEVIVRFHLHPDVAIRIKGTTIFLRMATGRPWYFDAPNSKVAIEDSVYFENGKVQPTKQIVVRKHVIAGDARVEWRLAREGRAANQFL